MLPLQFTPFYLFNRTLIKHSNFIFRGVLRTPCVPSDPSSDIILYSLMEKQSVRAYLLAVKSFMRYCPPMNVVIQSDGTLDHTSRMEIRAHIPHATFISRESTEELLRARLAKPLLRLIGETNCFVELKLLNPLLRFPGKYVIIFDSDLLFMRRPDAVVDCMTSSPPRLFHLSGGNVLAEPFHKIGFDFGKVDIRSFNSGFIGFLDDFSVDVLVPIVDAIRHCDPALLKVWDLEQALWSVLLNHSENPLNLKTIDSNYVGSGWGNYRTLQDKCVMAHFVGATRFRNLMYVRLARQVIRELRHPSSPR